MRVPSQCHPKPACEQEGNRAGCSLQGQMCHQNLGCAAKCATKTRGVQPADTGQVSWDGLCVGQQQEQHCTPGRCFLCLELPQTCCRNIPSHWNSSLTLCGASTGGQWCLKLPHIQPKFPDSSLRALPASPRAKIQVCAEGRAGWKDCYVLRSCQPHRPEGWPCPARGSDVPQDRGCSLQPPLLQGLSERIP